jgi:phosphonate transport system substrate-binding protein
MTFLSKMRRISPDSARGRILATVAALVALLAGTPAARAETLVLGTVGMDVKARMSEHEGLALYLQKELASSGVDQVEVTILPTAAKMTEALRAGEVDIYFESPLVAAKMVQEGATVPMLRRWRKGVAEYWSEIVVPSDSSIRSLGDLRGRVIAFEDPDSTSGFMLPKAMLLERGLDVEILKRPSDPVDPKKVGAVFTMSDKGSILMLFDRRVAAAATDPQYIKRVEGEQPGWLRSLARSINVPRHVVMRSVKMSEERAKRIAEILKGMNGTEEGRRVLQDFRETDRFDDFPGGIEATFAPLNAQLQLLEIGPRLVTGTQ